MEKKPILTLRDQFDRVVKTGAVENYSADGYRTAGDSRAMELISSPRLYWKPGILEHFPGYTDGTLAYTSMILIPLSYPLLKQEPVRKLGRQNVAIVTSFFCDHADTRDPNCARSGSFKGISIMSASDGETFILAVIERPWIAYRLVTYINNSPILQANGKPAHIVPGVALRIFPNKDAGGTISRDIWSVPFSPEFHPNRPLT